MSPVLKLNRSQRKGSEDENRVEKGERTKKDKSKVERKEKC